MNVVPLTLNNEFVVNGVFEIPFINLDLDLEVFDELNHINPWQFHYRFMKEKKAMISPVSVIYRQCYGELAVPSHANLGHVPPSN